MPDNKDAQTQTSTQTQTPPANGDNNGAGTPKDDEPKNYKTLLELEQAKRTIAEMKLQQQEENKNKDDDGEGKGKIENKILDAIDESIKKERENAADGAILEQAVKFNLEVSDFVKKHNRYLPTSTVAVVETLVKRTAEFGDAKILANTIRQNVLDNYFRIHDNIMSIPDYDQKDIQEYVKLSEHERRAQSLKYWRLLQVSLDRKAIMSRNGQVQIANGSGGLSETAEYNNKFFENSNRRIINKGDSK